MGARCIEYELGRHGCPGPVPSRTTIYRILLVGIDKTSRTHPAASKGSSQLHWSSLMDFVTRLRKPPDPRWSMLAVRRRNPGPTRPDLSQRWIAWGAIGLALATAATAAVSAFAVIRSDEANREQLQIAERGQINDRFATANEQLASDKFESRVGGIYALEQIMRDASDYYEDPIIEILSAYVRSHDPQADAAFAFPTVDIQAALTVLGRRPNGSSHRRPDLSYTNLSWANLIGANLIGANLSWTNLIGANLSGANLTQANLSWANLSGANLSQANLHQADLTRAALFRADLTEARLEEANLTDANLGEANLTRANLTGTAMPSPSASATGQSR